MATSENFTEDYLDHVVQVLKSLEIENNGMWIHPNEYARLLGLEPTPEFGLHQRLIHLQKRLKQKKKLESHKTFNTPAHLVGGRFLVHKNLHVVLLLPTRLIPM